MICLGIDVGSISAKVVALGGPSDREVLESFVEKNAGEWFVLPRTGPEGGADGEDILVASRYRRIAGQPVQTVLALLEALERSIPPERFGGIRATGTAGRQLAGLLGVGHENEFLAIARGVGALFPGVRTVFEMGGENSKLINLEAGDGGFVGISDYSTNGDCAAGTGSFMDQQASRLGYRIEEVGDIVAGASKSSRIAGRCSVFAKSDMIHVQQKGDQPPEILRGLCDAVVRNFKGSITKGKKVDPPVIMLGGVAKNSGIVAAMREAFDLGGEDMIIPEAYAWMGAIGCALIERDATEKAEPRGGAGIGAGTEKLGDYLRNGTADFPVKEPLSLEHTVLLRDRVDPYPLEEVRDGLPVFLGIDIGSVSTNLALIDASGRLIHGIYLKTAGRPIQAVNKGLAEIEERFGDRIEVRGVGTTGSGRELIGELIGADTVNDEITAHKTGATIIGKEFLGLDVDTIFDIGGQDAKYIRIHNGVVVDFHMNEACAAGTGSFLEEQAEKLGINIIGEFAERALRSPAPLNLGERCTVFMEKDVNACLQRGGRVDDIIAGLAYSICYNYINRVVKGREIGDVVFFQGGTAYNDSVAAAMGMILGQEGKKVIVPPHNGILGAYGEALLTREKMQHTGEESGFRGYNLEAVDYTIREITCRSCSNFCDVQVFTVENEKTYWGDKCSYKFRKRAKTDRSPVIPDLIALREELLHEGYEPEEGEGPLVGFGRSMYYYDRFPFWNALLRELGFRVVLSDVTNKKIKRDGLEACVSDPCYPKKVAHGHIRNLLDKGVDYILSPNQINMETPDMKVESYLCIWGQSMPFVLRHSPQFREHADRFLIPTVHFRYGPEYVRREIREWIREEGLGRERRRRADRAVERAYAAQARFERKKAEIGADALRVLREKEESGIVFVGRSYNIYDREVSLNVPDRLRSDYGVNVIPMDFLPLDSVDIRDINSNMFWNYGRRILAAARIVGREPNLHMIYFTNFKCGPDSFIKHFTPKACGKPYLTLQLDEHGADAGTMTRVEAYLDSKGFLRWWAQENIA
jgi:predicted CoA-substrate-specific enzyme activase